MQGLVNTAMGGTEEKDVLQADKMMQATATGYQPEKRGVTADETVAGQVDKIVAKDSPLQQAARARSTEQMNARGLVNSSLAVGAGEKAVIESALPIAAADAQTHNLAARDNQQAGNAALQFGADASNRSALTLAGDQNQVAKIREQGKVETGIQTLRGEQATSLANIEANYRQLIQASDSASRLYNTSQQAIAAIQADPNTSTEQKTAAVQKMTQMLESGLTIMGSIANIDLAGLLDFSAQGA